MDDIVESIETAKAGVNLYSVNKNQGKEQIETAMSQLDRILKKLELIQLSQTTPETIEHHKH